MEITKQSGSKRIFSPFVIELLLIMFIVEFVKGALLLTILPIYMKTVLGASAFVIGWTLAAQYIGDNALRTPVGWIIDKIGYRTCMLSGVVLTFLSIILIAITSQNIWTIIGCAILGFGTAPLWPCVVTGVTEAAGEQGKATVLSVVYMAWLSGVGLGPVVINFFIHGSSYGSAFRLLIGSMAAAVIVALFLPKRPVLRLNDKNPMDEKGNKPGQVYCVKGKERKEIQWFGKATSYIQEVRQSMSVSPLLFPAMFAQTFALGILTPILTLYARDVLGLSPNQYSILLITGGLVTVLFLIPIGKWVDQFGKKWFLMIGFSISSAILILFTFIRSMSVLYAAVALIGIGYACIIPSWNALIASAIPPEKRGTVWGFFLTIEGLGMIVGPIVSGKLWDLYGPHVPFMTSGTVLLVLLVLQWFISLERKVVIR